MTLMEIMFEPIKEQLPRLLADSSTLFNEYGCHYEN